MEARSEVVTKRMGVAGYASKTPEAVRAEDADKLGKLQAELAAILSNMGDMQKILNESQ